MSLKVVLSFFLLAFCQASTLMSCQISSSPGTVDSIAQFTITATYFLTSPSTTVTLYLTRTGMTTFFPSTYSSNIGTAVVSDERLEIQDIPLNGAINSVVDLIITVTGFKNPSSACSASFTCKDSSAANSYSVSFTPTPAVLTGTFELVPILGLNVISDQLSTVGGYYPLTIEITPKTRFPKGGRIIIPDLTLQSVETDCSGLILQKQKLETVSCLYESHSITITASTLSGNLNELTSADKIVLSIDKVQYNTKMTPKDLSVTLQDSSQCTIALGTKASSWAPANPAQFNSLTLSYYPGSSSTVCSSATLLLALRPLIQVNTDQMVAIEVLDISSDLPQALTCVGITGTQISGKLIKGMPSWTWYNSDDRQLFISSFILPNSEKPFRVKVTTYAASIEQASEIVHQQISNELSAERATVVNPGKIKIVSEGVVSETSAHSFTLNVPCPLSTEAKFQYTLPSVYDATSSCKTSANCELINEQQFIINNALTVPLNKNDPLSLSFETRNPPTTAPVTQSFQITGYDSNYASFVTTTFLDTEQSYLSGTLSNFQTAIQDQTTYSSTEYTISFTTVHNVLAGSTIVFTFPTLIDTASATLKSVLVNGLVVHTAQSVTGSLVVSNAFTSDLQEPTQIQVVFENVKNPVMTGTYSEFSVTIQHNGYTIDSVKGESVSVTFPKAMTASCSLSNKTNSADSNYTFTVKSTEPLPNLTEYPTQYIYIKKPFAVPFCDPASLHPASAGLAISEVTGSDPVKFKVEYPVNSLEISFKIVCTNPPTTQPTDPFTITLFIYTNNMESKSLKGEVSVTTEIGEALEIPIPAQNTPTYPSYPTTSRLSIARKNAIISIHKIVVKVPSPLLPAPSPACTLSGISGYSCEFVNGDLEILFTSPWLGTSFDISSIHSTNPTTKGFSSATFSVITYTKVDTNYYIVEQAANAGKLWAACDYPCKECLDQFPIQCTSCVDIGTTYYLVTDTKKCKEDSPTVCGSGYYKNVATKTCESCQGECKECSGSVTFCTSCIDPSKVLFEGECKSTCDEGYYKPSGSATCKKCLAPCETCEGSASFCKSCTSGYYLTAQGDCVTTCKGQTYADPTTQTCKQCDLTKCYTCTQSATHCISCQGTFLKGSTCLSESECVSSAEYIADSTKWLCIPCDPSCLSCKTTPTTCTKCAEGKVLYSGECRSACPTGYFIKNGVCQKCAEPCASCAGSESFCLDCREGTYLETDTHACVFKCGTNYYLSGKSCMKCDDSCLTCSGNSKSCTSCGPNLYLAANRCVTQCPASTYALGTLCEACSPMCSTCFGSSDRCTSCANGKLLDGSMCVTNCSEGKVAISGTCMSCLTQCRSCVGEPGFCTSCRNPADFLYEGKCNSSCPKGTFPSRNQTGTCEPCSVGCEICSLSNNKEERCVKCESGYKMLDEECVYTCPENYTVSSDGTKCVKIGKHGSANVTEANVEVSEYEYVPFPMLIAAVIFIAIPVAGWARNPKSLLMTNLSIGWTLILLVSLVIQALNSFLEDQMSISIVTLASLSANFILNLAFAIPHRKYVLSDSGFFQWCTLNPWTHKVISLLSYILSFQMRKLYYSRFAGFDYLYAQFQDIKCLLEPLSYLSIPFMILTLFPVCIIDIYGFLKLDWGNQLIVTVIETFVLSICIMGLIIFETRYAKNLPEELHEDDSTYKTLNGPDNNDKGKSVDLEEMRKRILGKVLDEIKAKGGTIGLEKEPIRMHTQPDGIQEDLETDPRKVHSYPCTPKVAKKLHGFFSETRQGDDGELPDNVYYDAAVEKGQFEKGVESFDYGVQTVPMEKLEEFKKMVQDRPGTSHKLFEFDTNDEQFTNPLEISDTKTKAKGSTTNSLDLREITLQKGKEPGNKDLSESKQTADNLLNNSGNRQEDTSFELKIETCNKPTLKRQHTGVRSYQELLHRTFFEKVKTPDIFDSSDGFRFSMARLEKHASRTERSKTGEKPSDTNEILGLFDRDEQNAILIRQTAEGKLVDKEGRNVNQFGYLVDSEENVINRKGELVLEKDAFDKELDQATLQAEAEVKNEEVKKEVDQKASCEKSMGRSADEDPLMEESPSKYNALNTRYESPALNNTDSQLEDVKVEEPQCTKTLKKNVKRLALLRSKAKASPVKATQSPKLNPDYWGEIPPIKSKRTFFNRTTYRKKSPMYGKKEFSPLGTEGNLLGNSEDFYFPAINPSRTSPLSVRKGRKPATRQKTPRIFHKLSGSRGSMSPIDKDLFTGDLSARIEENYATLQDKIFRARFPKVNLEELLNPRKTPVKTNIFSGNRRLYTPDKS